MRNSTRWLVYVGLGGALWGAVEISLGAYLHSLHIPLRGLILSTIGITIALVTRCLVQQRGTIIATAAIAAILKMFSVGGVILSPMAAILIQGLLAELVTFRILQPSRIRLVLAGATATAWTFFHPFVGQGVIAGQGVYVMYLRVIEKGVRLLHLPPEAVIVVIILMLLIRAGAGAVGGYVAGQIVAAVRARLGPAAPA